MKLYGYAFGAEELQKFDEVSIQATPNELRRISQFLLFCAELIEVNGDNFGHQHLNDFLKKNHLLGSIKEIRPDIIVAK